MCTMVLATMLCARLAAGEDLDGGAPDAGGDVEALARRLQALEDKVKALEPASVAAETADFLDVKEPPFPGDWSWLNGSNFQPASLLRVGPVTATFAIDAAYGYQFSNPVDHTVFPTTSAARHAEFSLNLAWLGLELNGLDGRYGGPIGRVELQYGSYIATIHGQDTTLTRGFFLSNPTLSYVKQAGAGWHFHVLHGLNVEVGIFPSYIALESFVPQENWNYTHPFVSDFTPYYFSGLRTQLFPTAKSKLELWFVNGWQSFGRWHDNLTGGYLYTIRPTPRLALTHTFYVGQEQTRASDPRNQSLRVYSDNHLQLLVFDDLDRAVFQRLAFALVADVGYEIRGPNAGQPAPDGPTPPNGWIAGSSLTARVEWTRRFMTTLRADLFYDQSAAVVMALPLGSPYSLPGNGSVTNPWEWLGGGLAATIDFRPSPWLLVRAEYARRWANQPYFSGRGGITGPNGLPPTTVEERDAFTPDLQRHDDRVVGSVTLRL